MVENEQTSIETKEAAKVDKEKLKYALEYDDWLNRFVDCIESKEIFNFIPKQKDKL
ncbi:hypothetical protein [Alkalihalobacillus deserti]|uniref:hypothetical protein n=1 Tax=Alkalihalobacillus deserti TaxID=2879466 RepID=UPI001D1337A4|nr:hypothetical protein [Alkalihalobacillus deserti]